VAEIALLMDFEDAQEREVIPQELIAALDMGQVE